MISSFINSGSVVTAVVPNPAVPKEVLVEILHWKESGLTFDKIIDKLRVRTVPPGYPIHFWTPGKLYC